MKKSGKAKLLASLLPLSAIGLAPIAILTASCQSGQIDKLNKEIQEKEQKIQELQKEKNNTNDELNKIKDQLNEKNEIINDIERENNIKPQNDDKVNISSTSHSFKNYNPEYTVNDSDVNVYEIKDDKSKTAYVDIDQFLSALTGLIGPEQFSSYVDKQKNRKTYYTSNPDGTISNKLVIDWNKNTIFVTTTDFFYEILRPQELTDGGEFAKYEYERIPESDKGVTFDLGKYHMDILYKDDKVLVPFSVFNTLFMSWTFNNIYYNGKTFTNVFAGLDSFGKTEEEARERIRKDNNLHGSKPTKEEREANFNHLSFTMDYFYGLREYKQIKSFADYIKKEDKEKLLSTDPKKWNEAYISIFHKQLNELHTRMNSFSYYEATNYLKPLQLQIKDYGQYRIDFNKQRAELVKGFEAYFKKKIADFKPEDYVKYVGNTAFVTLLHFEDGTKEQNKSDEAWKHDTYHLMRYLMKEVAKEEHKNIKNIVLNIAINGGGSVGSMVKTLGFMTDKPILNREFDILNRVGSLSKGLVDTNGDDIYEGDAYTQYNWNILVGINTFSAANQLTSIVKEMGIAKIIGQKTGGGMSAIMPLALSDGTTITISGPNNATFGKDNKEIESGVQPDIKLDYKDFYNYDKIDKMLSAQNQKQDENKQ
ncbi:S41 family peptidase [Mycoplasma sp. 1890]